MKFSEFNLSEPLLEAISYMNFDKATPIQEKAIPAIMRGNDLIACAQTGTGKTAAFVLPVLNKISEENNSGISALIIVPTRELAIQVEQQIQGFSYFVSVNSLAIYGGGDGMDWDQEKAALTGNTDIIVATPGRIMAHLKMGYVKFDTIKYLILDEADKMLDMGFYEDIRKIISYIPETRQTLMFSATMPPKIRQLAKHILKKPEEITIELSKPAEGVLQAVYLIDENQKSPLINSLLKDKEDYSRILIFTSTKSKVSEIVKAIGKNGYVVEGISSNLEQHEREEVLLRFRSRMTKILVATDVLSRGIDIKDIELIINFDVPQDAEDYVHRVGRTARADSTGVAITMVTRQEMHKLRDIERLIGYEIMRIPPPQ